MAQLAMDNKKKDGNFPFLAGLAVAIFFFVSSGYVTYSRMTIVQGATEQVTGSYNTLLVSENILSLLSAAEGAAWGFIITGENEYLEPYNEAVETIPRQLDKLKAQAGGNPQQLESVAAIKAIIDARLEKLSAGITKRRENVDLALEHVRSGEGKAIMDRLREAMAKRQQEESDLRQKRYDEMAEAYKTAIAAGIAASLLGITLSIGVTWLLRRAATLRRRDEWLQAGQAGLAAAMLGDMTIQQLAQNTLKFLAEYLDAHVGSFFVKEDGSSYKLAAAYGVPANSNLQHAVQENDGLLGQAITDRRAFIIRDVPDGYLKVGSSIGQSNPRQIAVSPAVADDAVNAVFELGFVHPLDAHTVTLLEQTSKSIGIAVQSANYRTNLQRLLEETQTQAEELQTQSEELRTSNEELEEQSRVLKESQARLEQQQEELETSNEELEEKTKALEEQNERIRRQTKALDEGRQLLEEKARELELSSKYKSEFLANMSHELRTPLNSLLILAKNLAANDEGNLTQEQVEESNIIYNGGLDLLNLINDILDLSKVEAGKLNIITNDVVLHDIAQRIERQFAPVVTEKGLRFKARIAEDAPEMIHTDAQRVEQILKNLLSNAFKFTEEGSVILDISRPDESINLRHASLQRATAVAFSVTDTGIGIDETKLNSIFEAFQQEDGSTDRHYGGTGLGLTIARKFAHMLGGEIQVSSKKGKGSTFTLILPEKCVFRDGAKEADARKPSAAPVNYETQRTEQKPMPKAPVREIVADDRNAIGKKDKTLLIIEDDRDFAQVLMKMAQARGYKCLVAGDGKTGIVMATEQTVSAILLDLRLPDIDGLNVLDQLKHDLRIRHIPVHIITGRDDADATLPMRKGAIGYLTKPVTAEDLDGAFEKIEDVLKSSIKKILVVEDDRKSQAAIQNLLKKKDLELVCVGMGHAALKRLAEESFDCVILDLLLPDMTGFDWLANVTEQEDNGRMPPVIIYTAKELTEEENRKLSQYTGSIVIKGAHSSERLLDEVTLFLHSVESTLSKDQQAIIRMQHNPDKVLQDRTILLVDDDLRNTFALSKMLKKHGVNVVIADNGEMALDKLKQDSPIELVIMDIMMPIMDGYQAMRKIRENRKWAKLPIIALTARAMPEEQEKCMESGANDYLTKPVDIERLLTLMRVWLFKQENVA